MSKENECRWSSCPYPTRQTPMTVVGRPRAPNSAGYLMHDDCINERTATVKKLENPCNTAYRQEYAIYCKGNATEEATTTDIQHKVPHCGANPCRAQAWAQFSQDTKQPCDASGCHHQSQNSKELPDGRRYFQCLRPSCPGRGTVDGQSCKFCSEAATRKGFDPLGLQTSNNVCDKTICSNKHQLEMAQKNGTGCVVPECKRPSNTLKVAVGPKKLGSPLAFSCDLKGHALEAKEKVQKREACSNPFCPGLTNGQEPNEGRFHQGPRANGYWCNHMDCQGDMVTKCAITDL